MKKIILLILLAQGAMQLIAQDKTAAPDLSTQNYKLGKLENDTTDYKDKASNILRHLKKDGSLIVRLKTSAKSIEAYDKAGLDKVADKVAKDRKNENDKIYEAFRNNFTFCKVYFIYSEDTRKFQQKKKGLLLNSNLKYDTKLALANSNYIFCEYGSAEPYSKFTDNSGYAVPQPSSAGGAYEGANPNQILDTVTHRTTTDPTAVSVLFFSDRNLVQLHTPFPMSETIHDNEFDTAVRKLNADLEAAYYNLVTVRDLESKKDMPQKGKSVASKK